MSARYEMVPAARLPITLRPAGYDFGYGDVFDTPALVIGDPGSTALVVVGTTAELVEALDDLRRELGVARPRTEVVVDRNPDGATDVRVWRDSEDVTDDPDTTIVVIDPGSGWDREEWEDHSDLDGLSEEPKAHALGLKDVYADSEYITD